MEPPPAPAAPAPAEAEGESTWTPLPPEGPERDRRLAAQRPQARLFVNLFSSIVARMPPQRPLDDAEKQALQEPLEECLDKWVGDTSPEMKLIGAALAIVGGRYLEARLANNPALLGALTGETAAAA